MVKIDILFEITCKLQSCLLWCYFHRSKPNIGTSFEDNIRRAHTNMFIFPRTYTRNVQKASRPVSTFILQEHGPRGTVAGVRAKTHDYHPANYRIR